MEEETLIILVQRLEYLYNLQHKNYDNNLVKDNCWKEIAGELHAQGKKFSRRRNGIVCLNRPLTRQGNGMGMAWYVCIGL
jgi:hypothetical protein